MRFWDKAKKMVGQSEFNLREHQDIAMAGDALQRVISSGAMETLEREIFEPMERDAFEVFKKIAPDNTLEILQAQKISQVIQEIRRRINKKIDMANEARQSILENSTLKEGEI